MDNELKAPFGETEPSDDGRRTYVWDLPVRAFHWSLVILVTTSLVTGKTGHMDIHQLLGFGVLTLMIFRLIWGVVGGRHARFNSFLRGPMAVIDYLKRHMRGEIPQFLGHNPMGGWSVAVMIGLLALQTATGLFGNDDILVEGPLMQFIEKETSDYLTWVHYLSSNALMAVIALHLSAIAFYRMKGESLVKPMITGIKEIHQEIHGDTKEETDNGGKVGPEINPRGNVLAALIIFAIAAGIVTYVVNL